MTKWLLVVMSLIGLGVCQRKDPLSVVPNDRGTALLRDTLLGSDTRLICITRTLREPCTLHSAEIVIEKVEDFLAVRAEWSGDDSVTVTIAAGEILRFRTRSRDGQVAIQRGYHR